MNETGMTALPAATASRLRRPSWRDWRLLVGLILMLAAVAAGARVVALADETVPVYAAKAPLPPGTSLSADVLTVAHVRLTGTAARYLDARGGIPPGRVLLRTVGPGEVVPMSAVGSPRQLSARPVAIPLDGPPPAGLVTGGLADVWASERERETGASTSYATPRRLARAVEVFHVASSGGSLSAGRTATVEVLLNETELPLVLDALANEARTAIVPVPGTEAGDRPIADEPADGPTDAEPFGDGSPTDGSPADSTPTDGPTDNGSPGDEPRGDQPNGDRPTGDRATRDRSGGTDPGGTDPAGR